MEEVLSSVSVDDIDLETLKFLSLPVGYVSGLPVHIPSPAIVSILEMMGNPAAFFIKDIEFYSPADIKLALYLCVSRKQILSLNVKNFPDTVEKWFFERKIDEKQHFDILRKAIDGIDAGFRMIPKSDGFRYSGRIYDADWLSWIVSIVSQVTNYLPEQILWDISVLRCGFFVAQYCRMNGIKVRREIDHEKLFRAWREKRWRN